MATMLWSERRGAATVDVLLRQACTMFADSIAIESPAGDIRYSELSSRAQSLADELAAAGVTAGDVVGIVGRRSAILIETVFAAWTAGAVVLLVDEALPAARREAMLAVIPTRVTVLCTDDGRIEWLANSPDAGRLSPQGPDATDHAYVAFTSGSTGTPKAIIGSQLGLVDFLCWQAEEFGIGPDDRFAHVTNPSFDVWFRDALTPLVSGATLCIPDGRHLDVDGVREFLRDERITGLHLVPSLGKVWTTAWRAIPGGTGPIPSLRHAFFAGEPLDAALVLRWQQDFPQCQVVNLYGPTETTLAQHFHRVPRPPAPGIQAVGRNRPHSRTFVLVDGRPAGPAQIGDVFIAADHPAHGYFVDAEIVAPYVDIEIGTDIGIEQVTAYRTGDLGRWQEDGNLEILGRTDDQIKIAGVRIELQEVRAVIQAHHTVRDVFVCAHDDRFTKVIVAVVAGDPASERELRDYLAAQLANVMVPSAFFYLADLPKLPNGKLDRSRLTDLARDRMKERERPLPSGQGSTAPVADRLERVWLDALGGGPPRISDHGANFFDLGGNSLTIVVLHAAIQAEFGLRFPLVRLFEHPSFEAQRTFLTTMRDAPVASARAATAGHDGVATRSRVLSSRRSRPNLPTRQGDEHAGGR